MILQLEEHLKVKVHDKGKGKWQPGLRTEIKEYTPLAELQIITIVFTYHFIHWGIIPNYRESWIFYLTWRKKF